jgi:hypothetical protein
MIFIGTAMGIRRPQKPLVLAGQLRPLSVARHRFLPGVHRGDRRGIGRSRAAKARPRRVTPAGQKPSTERSSAADADHFWSVPNAPHG